MKEFESTTITFDSDVVAQKTITTSPGQESSIEIKEDAKGCPRLTVKVYHSDPDVALEQAIRLYEIGLQRLERIK